MEDIKAFHLNSESEFPTDMTKKKRFKPYLDSMELSRMGQQLYDRYSHLQTLDPNSIYVSPENEQQKQWNQKVAQMTGLNTIYSQEHKTSTMQVSNENETLST